MISPRFERSQSPPQSRGSHLQENSLDRQSQTQSRGGFGTSSGRFESHATFTPGVGRYNLTPEHQSSLLIESPSVSKRGFKGSFASKTPKFSPTRDSGVPGPNSYSLERTSISSAGSPGSPGSRAQGSTHSAAFSPSGKGRVPFPDPNPYPGPNSYVLHENPGVSPLLLYKASSSFISQSKRDSFMRKSDTPSPVTYKPGFPVEKIEGFRSDIQWSKSPSIRFQDLGKDNAVPGPQRYFNPAVDAVLYSPERSLRSIGKSTNYSSIMYLTRYGMHDSLGTYRGPYVGKQSERAPILPTFGVTKDRFQGSFCGNLADAAEKPGPGQYYENLAQTSTLQTPSFNAQFNPNLSPKLPSPSRPHTSSMTLSAAGSVSPGQQKMDDLMTTSTLHNHNTAASTNTNNHSSNRPQTTTTAVLHAFGRTQRK